MQTDIYLSPAMKAVLWLVYRFQREPFYSEAGNWQNFPIVSVPQRMLGMIVEGLPEFATVDIIDVLDELDTAGLIDPLSDSPAWFEHPLTFDLPHGVLRIGERKACELTPHRGFPGYEDIVVPAITWLPTNGDERAEAMGPFVLRCEACQWLDTASVFDPEKVLTCRCGVERTIHDANIASVSVTAAGMNEARRLIHEGGYQIGRVTTARDDRHNGDGESLPEFTLETIPPWNEGIGWILHKEVKIAKTKSLNVSRSAKGSVKNIDQMYGIDAVGRVWRREFEGSQDVFYWKVQIDKMKSEKLR
ncbi:MAG: hypothetical protein AB7N71_10330 [Phycisphaerae bacterium]